MCVWNDAAFRTSSVEFNKKNALIQVSYLKKSNVYRLQCSKSSNSETYDIVIRRNVTCHELQGQFWLFLTDKNIFLENIVTWYNIYRSVTLRKNINLLWSIDNLFMITSNTYCTRLTGTEQKFNSFLFLLTLFPLWNSLCVIYSQFTVFLSFYLNT